MQPLISLSESKNFLSFKKATIRSNCSCPYFNLEQAALRSCNTPLLKAYYDSLEDTRYLSECFC